MVGATESTAPRRPRRRSEERLRKSILDAGGRIPADRPGDVWRPWQNRALLTAADVDTAVAEVRRIGLVPHPDRPKNWDLLVALGTILERTSPRARVLEMGAARYSPLLVWLYQLGYRRLRGIDLVWPRRVRRGPITFEKADLTRTSFASASFDAIACLSVIEHGVDVGAYLREARRLLRPGGVLVTSTDYWSDPVDTTGHTAYGVPVRIFDRAAIESLLATAASLGFEIRGPVDLACRDRVVRWDRVGLEYTFVVLTLVDPVGSGRRGPGRGWLSRARRAVRSRIARLPRVGRRRSPGQGGRRHGRRGRRTGRAVRLDGLDQAATSSADLAALERTLVDLVLREPTDERRQALRRVLGRRLVAAEGWVPRIPGPARPSSPVQPGTALWLLDGPPPAGPAAPRARVHRVLAAAAGRSADLRPVALTLGPSDAGAPAREEVDGVTYVTPPLDGRHADATPPDVALDHEAWFASWVARTEGASVVHAVVGPGDRATGPIALALRRHLGLPLVVEWASGAEARLLHEADVLVVASEAERRALLERTASTTGPIDPDRLVVVPDPADEGGAAATVAGLKRAWELASRAASGR